MIAAWRTPLTVAAILFLSALPDSAAAAPSQAPGEPGWNDSGTLDLVARGIARRSSEVVDSTLQNYRADARGHVYFLLDAPELSRQTLVRTDQVAVEVYWRAPNQIRQRIVGLRERRELPITRLYYYLDRLTVVQDNYGQAIVIADGDNVQDVPHPVASGGLEVYDYRLTDSLTLRLPGVPDPVRVHQIQVRPKDSSRPAVVGTVFLEGTTGALVRMAFTFTPSAYVDPRLDYINVTLENGLWRGRFWLPHEQRLEIRRELPELDLPFGTVIRTRIRVGDYRFNEPLDDLLFASRTPITYAPADQRASFPFAEPIDAAWREEGVGPPADVAEIRREARSLMRERALSGLRRGRLGIGSASDFFRYNRAEGVGVGIGLGLRPAEQITARLHGGWTFGPQHPTLRLDASGGGRLRRAGSLYVNRTADVGSDRTVSGLTNSLGSLLFAADWTDPYHATGASVTFGLLAAGRHSLVANAALERQRSADLTSTFSLFGSEIDFRPVRPIDEGTLTSAGLAFRSEPATMSGGRWGGATVAVGRLAGAANSLVFARAELEVGAIWTVPARRAQFDLTTSGAFLAGEAPRQQLFLVGGRGTLPGYHYRAFAADRILSARGAAAADLLHPWLRGRIRGTAIWTGLGSPGSRAADLWGADGASGIRASTSAGVGLFYDLLRVELGRGLSRGGRTEVIIEFQQDFWDFL